MAKIIEGFVQGMKDNNVATVCLLRGGPRFDALVQDLPVRVGQDVQVELREDGSAVVVGNVAR